MAAGSDSHLLDEDTDESAPVVASALMSSYQAAVEQARSEAFELALSTLRGENPNFRTPALVALLEAARWSGALATFKLEVLEYKVDQSSQRQFVAIPPVAEDYDGDYSVDSSGALNAALDSLAGLPGDGAIRQLKDFLERAMGS